MVTSNTCMFRSILETSGISVENRLEVREISSKKINSWGLKEPVAPEIDLRDYGMQSQGFG